MNKYTIEQSGRSMIEMLGVLAIVGVLSVAGIAGYSKAMAKYKTNKVVDQVTMTAANIRTTFAGQGNYKDLTADVAHSLGLFPEEMDKNYDSSGVKNAMGGDVDVGVDEDDLYTFDVQFNGLSKDACSTLVTADWGSAAGLDGMLKTAGKKTAAEAVAVTDKFTPAEMQSSAITNASTICTCAANKNECSVGWVFK